MLWHMEEAKNSSNYSHKPRHRNHNLQKRKRGREEEGKREREEEGCGAMRNEKTKFWDGVQMS